MTAATITIDPIASETIIVPIIGVTPLIMNRFSEKAKRKMLDAMQGRAAPKTVRDPQADYEAAFHRTATGYGFPAVGFKLATVGAVRFYGKSIKMTEVRQFIFVHGEYSDADTQALVPITGEPKMREDVVRLSQASTDLRYRPEFPEWSATLRITYVTSCLARSSVLSLLDAGGMGVGVGEWRPEKNGEFGCYRIDTEREIEIVR